MAVQDEAAKEVVALGEAATHTSHRVESPKTCLIQNLCPSFLYD